MSIYTDNGYENRQDYHEQLALEHSVDIQTVLALSEVLGEEEDFDGLVTAVQDAALCTGEIFTF